MRFIANEAFIDE